MVKYGEVPPDIEMSLGGWLPALLLLCNSYLSHRCKEKKKLAQKRTDELVELVDWARRNKKKSKR